MVRVRRPTSMVLPWAAWRMGTRDESQGEAAERFRGDARAIVERGGEDAIRRQGILIDVQEDLGTLAAGAGGVTVSEVALGDADQSVGHRDHSGRTRLRGDVVRGGGSGGRGGAGAPGLFDRFHDQGGFVGM